MNYFFPLIQLHGQDYRIKSMETFLFCFHLAKVRYITPSSFKKDFKRPTKFVFP